MSLFDLSGQVALITGSTKGIGRAIAERMAEAGARVVLSSRNKADCAREAAIIEERYGKDRALACTADLSDRESLHRLVERTEAKWGALDCLVLNAWHPIMGTLEQMDETAFANALRVNIVNNLGLVKDALPLLKKKGGSIILISSIFGTMPVPEALVYGIVKGVFNYLATTLAVEYAPYKIRANAIAPGLTRSAMSAPIMAAPEILNPVMENVPLARPGEGDDIAAMAVLLASPGGSFITGQTIAIDGGWSLEGRSARAMLQGIGRMAARAASAKAAGGH